jgi:hypothetical protein
VVDVAIVWGHGPPVVAWLLAPVWEVVAVAIVVTAAPAAETTRARRSTRLELASALLYALSWCLPALVIVSRPLFGGGGHDERVDGLTCLLYGWVVPFGWMANPLYWVAALGHAFGRRELAFVCAWAAFAVGLISPVFLGEDLRYPHVGYAVWVASLSCLAIAATRRRGQP